MTEVERQAADSLRRYLRDVGFAQIYKYVVGSSLYAVHPAVIGSTTAANITEFFDEVLAEDPSVTLLRALMGDEAVAWDRLDPAQRQTAGDLLAAGFLAEADGRIGPSRYQLISAFGRNLLIDRRIHFGGGVHEVYIGFDSYAMLNYVDPGTLKGTGKALDLCTGSGVAALYLSLFCQHTVATDIGTAPLALSRFNRRLNGCEDGIEIRDQPLDRTLTSGERFDVLTCNPPFVAYPPDLRATLYSQGTDLDGQGYMRDIIEALPTILTESGSAFIVADLIGNQAGPYFEGELEAYAARLELSIDLYIDNTIEAEVQVPPMSHYLARLNPSFSVEEMADVFRRFQQQTLRASHYHMTTMRLTTGAKSPHVRLFRRYALRRPEPVPKWRQILEGA
ncbi:MAG: methyltransferase [Pseudomonadota bacterium]